MSPTLPRYQTPANNWENTRLLFNNLTIQKTVDSNQVQKKVSFDYSITRFYFDHKFFCEHLVLYKRLCLLLNCIWKFMDYNQVHRLLPKILFSECIVGIGIRLSYIHPLSVIYIW